MGENYKNLVYLGATVLILSLGSYFLLKNVSLPNLKRQESFESRFFQEVNLNVNLGNLPPLGFEGAEVKIVEFGDFHCPFCALAYNYLYPELEKYISSQKVVFYFRDFPLEGLHPQAKKVHLASRCANEEGKYWEFHKEIYKEVFKAMNERRDYFFTGSDEYLLNLASRLGLNEEKFKTCLQEKKYEADINKDLAEGNSYGVEGTPTFFIIKKGKVYKGSGFVPELLPEFRNIIEK
jgi:protein-disulfide isomerase